MDCNDVKPGMKVKVGKLRGTKGVLIHHKHLVVRRAGVTGTVTGYVPGHGGDVWWVKHDDSDDTGAYSLTELEIVPTEPIKQPAKRKWYQFWKFN